MDSVSTGVEEVSKGVLSCELLGGAALYGGLCAFGAILVGALLPSLRRVD